MYDLQTLQRVVRCPPILLSSMTSSAQSGPPIGTFGASLEDRVHPGRPEACLAGPLWDCGGTPSIARGIHGVGRLERKCRERRSADGAEHTRERPI